MDILKLTKSKTREKILRLYLNNPGQKYYLRQMAKLFSASAGNIRRELLELIKLNLLSAHKSGRLVYYKINAGSPLFQYINALLNNGKMADIVKTAQTWVTSGNPENLDPSIYCHTRDVFSARLEPVIARLETSLKDDAYLLAAIIGEIGNNSFDHNLGNWPDIPGIYFACDFALKKIVLADRGQGILKTIKNVWPKALNHQAALNIAFTKIISGRFPEKRGNGLKFVANVIKEKGWNLQFNTGNARLILHKDKMVISAGVNIHGCLAVIKY